MPTEPVPQMQQETEIEADFIVVAMGGKADDREYLDGVKENVAPEIYNIGDSFQMARILEANNAAFATANMI